MYNATDIVEIGNAQELILSLIKEPPSIDDAEPFTLSPEEIFEQ